MTNQGGFHGSMNSTETEVVNISGAGFAQGGFTPSQPQVEVPRRSGVNPLLLVGLGIAVVFGVVGAIAFFLVGPTLGGVSETLPSHLGMFVQSDAKDKIDEIKRQDFTNAIEAKTTLSKDGSLPYLVAQPSLILYADGKDIPVNDVRLVQLDTLKDDGTMKTLDFQVAPIDGKNDMKRIRIPTQLATGKYAFTFFDGYFNEGKHKFWPFQVKDSSKGDNGDALKSSSISLKPTPPPQPSAPRAALPSAPSVPPPQGAGQATVRSGRVVLRNGPCLTCSDIGRVFGGQVVYVISYGGNYDTWGGRTGNWAYIQTPSGNKGWVFAPLLR